MTFTSGWIRVPTKYGFCCTACKSRNLDHRTWVSNEDCDEHKISYRCIDCHHVWWLDGDLKYDDHYSFDR